MESSLETAGTNFDELPASPGTAIAIGETPAEIEDGEDRNRVFQRLVTADDDVAGLVAYSIYKQNKLDWLLAFEKRYGRPPDESETAAYILGESTQRRLATYRHLAESTLRGSGLNAKHSFDGRNILPAYAGSSAGPTGTSPISYLILAVVVLIGIFLAARFGLVGK